MMYLFIHCVFLADKRTLVLGSAVYAFEQTCPDRLDLLHRHFRPLCRALADVDESVIFYTHNYIVVVYCQKGGTPVSVIDFNLRWGQIVMIGLLTRYARTQFTSP